MARPLDGRDFVYAWADGVHFGVRLEEDRLCCLVIVGVRLDGTKEPVANPSRKLGNASKGGLSSGGSRAAKPWFGRR